MKKAFLLLLLFSSFFADAQSLKEALFSGRLKNEPGTVIRKGDDLSTKMVDTTARKVPEKDTLAVLTVAQVQRTDSTQQKPLTSEPQANNTVSTTQAPASPEAAAPTDTAETTADAETEPEPEVKEKPKNNRTLFKEYITDLISTLKSEVLSNKKIKKEIYYVSMAYTIGTEGQVAITDLVVDPKQEFLQQQIRERIERDPPTLTPELNSSGVARKVTRRYNFSIEKE